MRVFDSKFGVIPFFKGWVATTAVAVPLPLPPPPAYLKRLGIRNRNLDV